MTAPAQESNPSEDRLRELLVGRRVVATRIDPDAHAPVGTLYLDDGTILCVEGNEGCGGCSSGWYALTQLHTVDNAITSVEVEAAPDDDSAPHGVEGRYRVFVLADARILLAEFTGTDGNGWYGTGWWLTVVREGSS